MIPKLCGGDIEFGNFVLGLDRTQGSGWEASRALLREINGHPPPSEYGWSRGGARSSGYDPQDHSRKFLATNGGCFYIDLDHLEGCLPEVLSAHDHLACWHATLRLARRALHAANAQLPTGQRIQVLVNNSDGQGHSYGSHLDFLVGRRTWDNLFHRKPHHLLFLASFQASSIVLTGQGKVGSENDAPAVAYQIAQRADFFESLVGEQTTHRRPLVNCRDEALCGKGVQNSLADRLARLHIIFYDSNLCHAAHVLKVGLLQIVLAMLEAEKINTRLLLDDPLDAVRRWSHDPALRARARMADGRKLTAVEVQRFFWDSLHRFVDGGGCDAVVPNARDILSLAHDTLRKLQARAWDLLAGRLDWVLKRMILERAMQQRAGLTWEAPGLKHLDHLYSSLDDGEGLYWLYEKNGLVERHAAEERITHFEREPPEDTRAWTRAMLLRQTGPRVTVEAVDWDRVELKERRPGTWPAYHRFELADPLAHTRAQNAALFETHGDTADAGADRDGVVASSPEGGSNHVAS